MEQPDNNDEESEELPVCHFCHEYIQPDDEDQSEFPITDDYSVPICGKCMAEADERDDELACLEPQEAADKKRID